VGVYHLMGLGRSPGAVTGPLSYLAYRYKHWNKEDQCFFARSGEVAQRQAGQKVGDVQALVLFTTQEVLTGKEGARGRSFLSNEYIENPLGRVVEGPVQGGGPMKEVLRGLLRKEWPGISGGRQAGTIFWCEVDRRDIRNIYERIVQVVAALSGVGGQGKEMWVNLTGGNNVSNFALELAATLSGDVARLYYVQAEDPVAEKCTRFTAEGGYWIELPVMPLALSRLDRAVLELLREEGSLGSKDLYGRLLNHTEFWNLVHGISYETFKDISLTPMWKQGLVAEAGFGYVVGPQWELIQPYEDVLQQARQGRLPLEQLAQREAWIEQEKLNFN